MSVTRTTVREVIAKLEAGHWEALSEIDAHRMVRILNVRTGSRFRACITDYIHASASKKGEQKEERDERNRGALGSSRT